MSSAAVVDPASSFRREFGTTPSHVARAPGRVNLIGEHIDYLGLPVFPMAIQREVRGYFRPRLDATIHVRNLDPQFGSRSFVIGSEIDPYPDGDWGNYLKAAAQGMERVYGSLRGIDAIIDSTLPVAAGLSSSSALVVLTGTCLLDASGVDASPLEIAGELARAEQYVGTRGGGMDQAICTGAEAGTASRVEFDPLRLTSVPVPDSWEFVIASSTVKAEKSGDMREAYNSRRRDCEEALDAVIAHLGAPGDICCYRDVLDRVTAFDLEEILDHVLKGNLLKRFHHVVTEATRVSLAEEAMRVGNLERFGVLMSESHASLRDDFEVSCAELDSLADIALAAGAAGARLTGAGFGGCVLVLSAKDVVDDVMYGLHEDYYGPRGLTESLDDHLFVAKPSAGATVVPLS